MAYGITSTASFNPTRVEDDRTAFERMRWDDMVKIFRHNQIPFNPTATLDTLRQQLSGYVASGRQIMIPLPGGAEAPLDGNVGPIAPTPVNQWTDAPQSQPVPQPAPPPVSQPANPMVELAGQATQAPMAPEPDMSDEIFARATEISQMKWFAIRSLAATHGLATPSGMTDHEKKALYRNIARCELEG